VLDAYTVESRLDDITDQMIVLQESGIFDLEFIVEMTHMSLESVLHTSVLASTSRARDKPSRMASYSA